MQRHLTFFLPLAMAAAAPAQLPHRYTITDLGVLPGTTTSAGRGISDDGTKIAGFCVDRAFVWEEGKGLRELPPLQGYTRAYAFDVNDRGFVAGTVGLEVTNFEPARAVLWDSAGVPTNLGVLGGGRLSLGAALNASNQVVGTSEVLPNTTLWHAFLWQSGQPMLDLIPGAAESWARGINTPGHVVGYASFSAWRWTPAQGVTWLQQPGGFAFSSANAINDVGQVCGAATSASGNTQRIARWTDGIGWELLGGQGQHNGGLDINAFGQVLGSSRNGPRVSLYTDGLGLQDVNQLVDPAAGWFVLHGAAMNDRGQISGYGYSNALAQTRALRLDPRFVHVRGRGCAGGNGLLPKLWVDGTPAGGQTLAVLLAQGRAHAAAVLLVGSAPVQVPLPGGCTALVGGTVATVPVALDAIGRAVATVMLPAAAAAGTVHLQYAALDAGAANGVFAASNAVDLQIQ